MFRKQSRNMRSYIEKIIFCFFIFQLVILHGVSQENIKIPQWKKNLKLEQRKHIKNTLSNAEYVFEGKIIRYGYYHRNDEMIFSQIVQIKKVYKGKLKLGTVEILDVNNNNIVLSEKRTIDTAKRENSYVFICRKAYEYPFDSKYNIDLVDNKTILRPYNDIGGAEINLNYSGNKPKGLDSLFDTKVSLYRYLEQFPKIKIPKNYFDEIPIIKDEIICQNPPIFEKCREQIMVDSLDKLDSLRKINKIKETHIRDSVKLLNRHKFQLLNDSLKNIKH